MTAANPPLISIVLPTYNVEKYVERCIRSLQAQEDRAFEMLFVDDCGQDRSMEIVERYAASDSRIRIVRYGTNKGTFAARHHGAKIATGKYIFFVDPDDEIPVNAVSRLCQVIEQDSPDLIVTGVRSVHPYKWYQKKNKYFVPRSATYPEIMKAAFLEVIPMWGTPGKIYRRELLLEVLSGFEQVDAPMVFGEDVLVYLTLANLARNMTAVPEELYWYHLNDTSITEVFSRSKPVSRSKYVWQLVQSDRIASQIEARIAAGMFAGPYAEAAALRVKHLFLKNTRGVCLGLLQDVNRNFALGIFAHGGGWRWALRIVTFFLTLGKHGFKS